MINRPYKKAIVIGKFMPAHKGHEVLLKFADKMCDELVVLVDNVPNKWHRLTDDERQFSISLLVSGVTTYMPENVMPQDPSECEDFWEIWCGEIAKAGGEDLDCIISCELYGKSIAEKMGIECVIFQNDRDAVPISATQIRNDLAGNWDYLPDTTKMLLRRHVYVLGGESTGKTTLCKNIVNLDRNKFTYVPEFAKDFGTEITEDDFRTIAFGQLAAAEALSENGNSVMVHDTDAIVTLAWFTKLFPEGDASIHNMLCEIIEYNIYDHVLLLDNSNAWVQDGTRFFEAMQDRDWFFSFIKDFLVKAEIPFTIIGGDNVLEEALNAIDQDEKDYIQIGNELNGQESINQN